MKTLAFVIGLLIGVVGAVGVIAPSGLVWIAEHAVTSEAFYLIAAIRIAFGLVLISVASVSRAPRTLRVLGYLVLIAGIATALTAWLAIAQARTMIAWWLQQGSGLMRLTGLPVLALGAFVMYACAPSRRSAQRP
jgi:hypothetical protein